MNMADLAAELQRLGMDPARYRLHGGLPNDGFAIGRQGKQWRVYYSERGGRYNIEKFPTEGEARERILALMVNTVRKPARGGPSDP
jgi:hypothetical protein